MKRVFWYFLALLLVMGAGNQFVFAANQPSTLVIAAPADVRILDPAVNFDNASWRQTYVGYDRLVQYDGSSTRIKPMLAKSWEVSKDAKVYTFKLRKDARFHDGTVVDAKAVKFSFDRLKKIGKGPSEAFAPLKEVQVVDQFTVRFILDYPFGPFLSTLATNGASIVNPRVMEFEKDGDLGQAYLADRMMGSGPYKIKEWVRDQRLVLEANNDYWGGRPRIQQVIIRIVPESSAQRMMLLKGEVDIAEGILIDQYAKLRNEPNVTVFEAPSQLTNIVYMNNKRPPLNNPKVRQALSYAVDYEGIIKHVLQGNATQMRGPIPRGMWGYDENLLQYKYDPAKAKRLLAEAGYPNGFKLKIMYADRVPTWEQEVLALQASFAEIGVKLEPELYAWPTLREKVDRADFDLSMGIWSPDYADPYMFMHYWFHSSNQGLSGNRAFYKNEKVDALLEQAAMSPSQQERIRLYQQAQKIIIEEPPYIFLYQRNFLLPMSKRVKGFVFNPMLENIYNFQNMSLE